MIVGVLPTLDKLTPDFGVSYGASYGVRYGVTRERILRYVLLNSVVPSGKPFEESSPTNFAPCLITLSLISDTKVDNMKPVTDGTTVVLVTGANQGIGYYISKLIAAQQPDYHIIMAGRKREAIEKAVEELSSEGLSVEPIIIDVNSDESIAKAAQEVDHKYGRLDVLINNAGITHRYIDAEGKSRRMIMQAVYDTNVFGTMEMCEVFAPLLSKSKKVPRIVFVSSSVGSLQLRTDPKTPTRGAPFTEYPSSKSAMNMLCLHYSVKYEKLGWKVNAHCPGLCKTHLNGFQRGQPPEDGAVNAVRLATLGKDGETGTFSDANGPLPW